MIIYITEPGTQAHLNKGQMHLRRQNEILHSIPICQVSAICISIYAQISSQLLAHCLKHDISISWVNTYGYLQGHLTAPRNTHIENQWQQFLSLQDSQFTTSLSQKIVLAKCTHNRILLQRIYRYNAQPTLENIITSINIYLEQIKQCSEIPKLRGLEGSIAKLFFQGINYGLPVEFQCHGRSQRPPLDSCNALLSFGYTLLFQELYRAIMQEGLHPYLGFYHVLRNHHPALASDLMEEWRSPLVDLIVLRLTREKKISLDMFENTDRGVFLTREGKNLYLKQYLTRLNTPMKYTGKEITYREAIHKQIRTYIRAVRTLNPLLYTPFRWR